MSDATAAQKTAQAIVDKLNESLLANFDPSLCSSHATMLVEAITAGIDAARPQWQPIETAPKDMTLVLAYMSDGTMGIMYGVVTDYHGTTPTHWMPLPPIPNDSQG